jgi:CRISPR-associated protein Csm3
MQFEKNLIIQGELKCETGLHIGGAAEAIEIGGVDNIVIRDVYGVPFIPGSSLKGKMRSLIELSDSVAIANIKENKGAPCKCGKCVPCKIFGVSASEEMKEGMQEGPTRLIVRDAFPTKATEELWKGLEEVVGGAEVKWENTINRITSAANPRQMERVPMGSVFQFEMIFSIYDEENYGNLNVVFEALKRLEDNYLGGSGTRGYGRIKFDNITVLGRSVEYYKGKAEEELIAEGATIEQILKILSNKDEQIKA